LKAGTAGATKSKVMWSWNVGIKLHHQMPSVTRTVFKFVFIAFCVAVFVDIDHLLCGRGLQHEPYIWCLACLIFMGVTFISGFYRNGVLE